MRSRIHSTFATLLLLIPVVSIPALAIFGIPQFAPVVVSPLDEGVPEDRESRIGQSARLGRFPEDLEDAPAFDPESERQLAESRTRALGSQDAPRRSFLNSESFSDPLASPRQPRKGRDTQRPVEGLGSAAQPFGAESTGLGPAGPLHSVPLNPVQPASPQDGFAELSLNPTVSNPANLTWNEAIRRLNELQIRDFRLGPGLNANEFLFVCSYTPSDSPLVSYRFEAESPEPLKAVENVLEQVVAWQQRRR